jgi:hypothetical protein
MESKAEMATGAEAEQESGELAGLPFAPGTAVSLADAALGTPRAAMALGGVVSALVLVPFAVVSLFVFPWAAILNAGLGVIVSLLGLWSRRPRIAAALLLVHAVVVLAALYESTKTTESLQVISNQEAES